MVSLHTENSRKEFRKPGSMPLDLAEAHQAFDGAVKYLCSLSRAPGDGPDKHAMAVGFFADACLAYLHEIADSHFTEGGA